MRKIIAILALALMAVGLILTAFGTQGIYASKPIYQQNCSAPNSYCVVIAADGSVSGGEIVCGTATPPNGFGSVCGRYALSIGYIQTFPNFDINYGGVSLAILGSVLFATLYPKKLSDSSLADAIPLY